MGSCNRLTGVFASVLALTLAAPVAAEDYPARPITLIVPFAAGGPTDVVSRVVGEHMSKTLKQTIVIDNVVGSPGITGSTRAMRAAPDGYTIVMGHMGTHAASVGLVPNLPYHPVTDFEPIGLAAGTPIVILGRRDLPPQDMKEFVPYLKVNAGRLRMAHAGVGSVSFMTCLMLNQILQVKPVPVPFNGTRPALDALVNSRIDYMCDQTVNAVPQLNSGAVKGYAIGTPERIAALPNVPTAKESGVPDFQVSAWNALFAPKGTPKPVLDRLTAALDKALDDEAVRKRLLTLGSDLPGKERRGPQALTDLVQSEIARWTGLVRAAGPLN